LEYIPETSESLVEVTISKQLSHDRLVSLLGGTFGRLGVVACNCEHRATYDYE
jgi:hypothetical protein